MMPNTKMINQQSFNQNQLFAYKN